MALNYAVYQNKTEALTNDFGDSGFRVSNGWLARFKDHQRILCKKICGESSTLILYNIFS